MVLSVLVAIIAAPALLGTQEAIRQSQSKEKREEHRARRCNLIASCVKSSMRSREINGRPLVLKNGKIYIDTGTSDGSPYGHQYAGYYLPYPDTKYEGLVTTITDEAPIMNWVYVDKETYELKYGVRLDAQPNLTGPFDCTRQDRRLTFDGWEGFCAVEEFPTLWAVYFDMDDNGLRSKIPEGTRVLEIELARKEKRWKKETESRQQDQTTKREVEATENAPVDKPITVQPQLDPPGVSTVDTSAPPEPFPLPKTIFPESPPSPVEIRPQTPPPAYTAKSDTTTQTQPQPKTPSPGPTNLQPSPMSEKRTSATTPKLNRSSGTRALAQAQLFEAMSQKSNIIQFRNSRSPSRPPSNSDSASEYSDQRNSTEVLGVYSARPDSSVLAPAAVLKEQTLPEKSVTSVSDPAVFGASPGRSPPRLAEPSKSTFKDIEKPYGLRRKSSFSGAPPSEAPKESLPPLPTSSVNRRPGSPDRVVPRGLSSSPVERRTASADRTRLLERRPTIPRDPPRSTPRPARDVSNPRAPIPANPQPLQRARGASTSSQNSETRSFPRPLARTNTTPASGLGRKSMATTMSSGPKTSMGRQMSPNTPPEMPRRERTNSSLYREIDDILKPSSSRGALKDDRRQDRDRDRDRDRLPPLRRAATSKPLLRVNEGDGSGKRKGPAERRPPGVF